MELECTRGVAAISDASQGFFEETRVPSAVRNGSTVWVTGQTGDLPDGTVVEPVEEQIRQAFANVEGCLSAAGASWSDVVEMTTYSVGLRSHAEVMLSVAGEFLASPFPAWTAIGVAELWEGAVFEMKCVAVVEPKSSIGPV